MIRSVDFQDIAAGQNLMVLVTSQADIEAICPILIAEACLGGRPPFLAVLTDADASGQVPLTAAIAQAIHDNARSRAERLGVPSDWFLMLGLHAGTAPLTGKKFEAVVTALSLIAWRKDCNVLVAPAADHNQGDVAACAAIALRVARSSGLGLVTYPLSPLAGSLDRLTLVGRAAAQTLVRSVLGSCQPEQYRPLQLAP